MKALLIAYGLALVVFLIVEALVIWDFSKKARAIKKNLALQTFNNMQANKYMGLLYWHVVGFSVGAGIFSFLFVGWKSALLFFICVSVLSPMTSLVLQYLAAFIVSRSIRNKKPKA